MGNNSKLNVGIVIPTLNRPDFVIRQLEYYAQIKSPHPVYIGDASNEENKKKLQVAIEKLSKHLVINYYAQPEGCNASEAHIYLYNKIKEDYCVFSGDDDYQIPDSLTKCAEFLESNPEYSSTSGHEITFRLVGNGVYGELQRLADNPCGQIEASTAAQRLIDFFTNYSVTVWSVQRTAQTIKSWSQTNTIKDRAFAGEILPCAMFSVLGKSKIIDCLSLVRQIGNPKIIPHTTFGWITKKNFQSSYEIFCETLAKEISIIDGIDIDEASKVPKQAFWSYLNIWLPIEYKEIYPSQTNDRKKLSGNLSRKLRLRLGQKLPWLKNIYLRVSHSLPNTPREFFYEVAQPSSPYHKDFQSVFDSFSGKYNKL